MTELRQYYAAVTKKWYQIVQKNLPEELEYTSESFWYHVQIVNPNVKPELSQSFEDYEHIYK